MAVMDLFKTTTADHSPLDASGGTDVNSTVSDFLTVQALANFAVMTGAISAAWHALQKFVPQTSTLWVPLLFAIAWGAISVVISFKDLKAKQGIVPALFVAVINSLILAGAIVGTDVAMSPSP